MPIDVERGKKKRWDLSPTESHGNGVYTNTFIETNPDGYVFSNDLINEFLATIIDPELAHRTILFVAEQNNIDADTLWEEYKAQQGISRE